MRQRSLAAAARRVAVCAALLLAVAGAACTPSEPLQVTGVQTGRSLNSDDSVGQITTSFRPTDTMYVAVLTADRGAGTLTARWRLGSTVIHEATREVAYNGQAATAFRFESADGFPVGSYTIEVLLDGEPVETRQVRVE